MRLLPKLLPRNTAQRQASILQSLIRQESAIGGTLFGPLAKGHRRQFFCLDEHTWVWHEEWVDASGQRQVVTTRYNVRPQGVLKSQNGHAYRPLSDEEARNFFQATTLYLDRVESEYQSMLQLA